jgi:hypothetical protein
MKNLALLLIVCVVAFSCNSAKNSIAKTKTLNTVENDTIRIANDEIEYEILIIEPGFDTWLASRAKPKDFYTQQYLESKNSLYVTQWNNRALNTTRFDSKLYELQIDYNTSINYGYEVNYLLYNYFIFFQNTYKQNLLGGRIPIN